eukprot:3547664-Prymnesium_polylepis.2
MTHERRRWQTLQSEEQEVPPFCLRAPKDRSQPPLMFKLTFAIKFSTKIVTSREQRDQITATLDCGTHGGPALLRSLTLGRLHTP